MTVAVLMNLGFAASAASEIVPVVDPDRMPPIVSSGGRFVRRGRLPDWYREELEKPKEKRKVLTDEEARRLINELVSSLPRADVVTLPTASPPRVLHFALAPEEIHFKIKKSRPVKNIELIKMLLELL